MNHASVILVAGTPGTEVPEATGRLHHWISGEVGLDASQWQVTDKFETFLVQQYNSESPSHIRNIRPLLDEPKPFLRGLWERTLKHLKEKIDSLAVSDNVKVLVPIHLVWYHQRHREYVSVLDPLVLKRALSPHIVSQVICLIDDIHDVYARLRKPGKLYNRHIGQDAAGVKRGHAVLNHLRVLDWRSKEIFEAESLALSLGIPVTVLATKHQCSAAYHVLAEGTRIYLSHPITELRRIDRSTSTRMQFKGQRLKEELWDLQARLAKRSALFQPTTIDEYRLDTSHEKLTLAERFYSRDRYTECLFSNQDCNGDNVFYDALGNSEWAPDEIEQAVAANLGQTVRMFIENQVTSRDLRLVTQAEFLVVYRPRFNGNLSGGVKEEISYFDRLRQLEPHRYKKVILLDASEDETIFRTRQLLEGMIAASKDGHFKIRSGELDPGAIVDYLDRISPETIGWLNALEWQQVGDDVIQQAMERVLKDLRPDADLDWTIGVAGETRPLDGEHTYTAEESKMAVFCDSLRNLLRPFEKRPPYTDCTKISIDDKQLSTLVKEISDMLDST